MAASKTVPASWAREVLGDAALPPPVAPVAASPVRVPAPARAAQPVDSIPEGLTGEAFARAVVDQEIIAVRRQLATARAEGALNTSALSAELRKLLEYRAELSPKEEADPAAEERRWREEASRVRARVEAGVRAFEEG